MTRANCAACLLLARESVSEDAIDRGWEGRRDYRPDAEILGREGAGGGPGGMNLAGCLWGRCAFPLIEAPALSPSLPRASSRLPGQWA
jgi:hypothetical protein